MDDCSDFTDLFLLCSQLDSFSVKPAAFIESPAALKRQTLEDDFKRLVLETLSSFKINHLIMPIGIIISG